MPQTLHLSKIIITNDKDPIFNGALLVHDSKIVQVGRKEDFGDLENKFQVIDHGEALICPGFINLHAHLAYSSLNRIGGKNGLFSWLENVVDEVSAWSEKDHIDSVKYGIEQVLSSGTTFVVENTPSHLSAKELAKSSLRALIGLEVFGSDEEKADEIFLDALDRLNNCKVGQDLSCPYTELTFSPHAPYDISKSLWGKLINWSNENKKPLLTHLEESPQEKLWWQEKRGQAVNFWEKINKLEPKLKYWRKYNSGTDFLNKNKLLSENIVAAHLCQATKEDLIILKKKNIKLVHCPRSNFYLNNGTANLKLWEEVGLSWGVGTDSMASNENLDLLEELRFTINQQNMIYGFKMSSEDAFKAITLNSAKIISKAGVLGCLKEGHYADFLVYEIPIKPGYAYKDPYNLIVYGVDNKIHLKEVWVTGKEAWLTKRLLPKI